MPGNRRAIERPWTTEERAALQTGAVALDLDFETVLLHLGETGFDVYLNEVAFWRAVAGLELYSGWLSSFEKVAFLPRNRCFRPRVDAR